VGVVVCQEKHMGSRAVIRLSRDGARDAIWTRTGRPFFSDAELTATLPDRGRAAVSSAGILDELATDWLLIDAELLPWSAKAGGLIREQYAGGGAAGRHALPGGVAGADRGGGG